MCGGEFGKMEAQSSVCALERGSDESERRLGSTVEHIVVQCGLWGAMQQPGSMPMETQLWAMTKARDKEWVTL